MSMWHARTVALCLAVPLCAGPLSACNTVEGFGRDMRQMGQKIGRTMGEPSPAAATRQSPAVGGAARPARSSTASPDRPAKPQAVNGEAAKPEAEDSPGDLDKMYEEQMERHAR
jgi:predicted small secreted protein